MFGLGKKKVSKSTGVGSGSNAPKKGQQGFQRSTTGMTPPTSTANNMPPPPPTAKRTETRTASLLDQHIQTVLAKNASATPGQLADLANSDTPPRIGVAKGAAYRSERYYSSLGPMSRTEIEQRRSYLAADFYLEHLQNDAAKSPADAKKFGKKFELPSELNPNPRSSP